MTVWILAATLLAAAVLALSWPTLRDIWQDFMTPPRPDKVDGARMTCKACNGSGWILSDGFWSYCGCVKIRRDTPPDRKATRDAPTREARTRRFARPSFKAIDEHEAEAAILAAALVDLVDALPRCGWPVDRAICGTHATVWCEGSGSWYCYAHAPDGYDEAVHAAALRTALALIGRG